ncbi:MAG TPA: TonB-dependent receptor [Clostridium sp.]|nr:TonB-dependent receptor [Clostridium sp.]
MRKYFTAIILLLFCVNSYSQNFSNNVKGVIKDAFTDETLKSATITLTVDTLKFHTISDNEGKFHFEKVNAGRISLQINHLGYEPYFANNLILASGKELEVEVKMEQSTHSLAEVTIFARERGELNNELAYVSSRSFDVKETERYAGTSGDPARMATYFAGVQAAGDSRNDIIIRGNSPLGLLYMLEGIPIPNPNHFATMGTNGGAISMLNNNQLSNSDFLTGAFPAQYGNATAGAFDLAMRNGNSEKFEYLLQMGTGGLEAGVEGPFSKNRTSSFMVNYRYAFLELFDKIGVNFGTPSIPKYQDLTFKSDFDFGKTSLSLWGFGGFCSMSMDPDKNVLSFTKNLRTEMCGQTNVAAITMKNIINSESNLRTSLAFTNSESSMSVDSVLKNSSDFHFFGGVYTENKLIATTQYKHRFNQKNRIIIGASYIHSFVNFADSAKIQDQYVYGTKNRGNYGLAQFYSQFLHSFNEKIELTLGVFNQYSLLNNSLSVEPRAAIRYSTGQNSNMSFAYGLHSQTQPGNVYFNQTLTDTINRTYKLTNAKLDFSKSHHFVLGYNVNFRRNFNLKSEVYYQNLFNIPIEMRSSHYSVINYGADFYEVIEDSLVNKGKGRNYGIELTLEKYFSDNYYFLITTSLFNSKYLASDNIWRNTVYNSNFVFNALGGYEIELPKQQTLTINANVVYAGGLRNIPIDLEKSKIEGYTVYDYDNAYKDKNPDFFKANIKLLYRVNKKKMSYECGIELTNITNRKNIWRQIYDAGTQTIKTDYKMGIMPGGLFRIYL